MGGGTATTRMNGGGGVLGNGESTAEDQPWLDDDSINGGYHDDESESATSSSNLSFNKNKRSSVTSNASESGASHGGSSGGGGGGGNGGAHDLVKNMFHAESRQLFWLRLIAGLVLAIATCAMSLFIYRVSRHAEMESFETQYHDHAVKVMDALESNVRHMIGAMDNFAVMATSHSKLANTPFPLEVMPQFEIRGASTKTLSRSVLLTFLPLVTNSSRLEFENFTINNMKWVQDGLDREEAIRDGTLHTLHDHEHNHGDGEDGEEDYGHDDHEEEGEEGDDDHDHSVRRRGLRHHRGLGHRRQLSSKQSKNSVTARRILEEAEDDHGGHEYHEHSLKKNELADFTLGISDKIFSFDSIDHSSIVDPYDQDGPYFPVWQTTPVHEELVNYNVLSHPSFRRDIHAAMESQSIVLGRITDVSDIHDPFHFIYRPISKTEDEKEDVDCTEDLDEDVDEHAGHNHRKLVVECHGSHEEEEEAHGEDEDDGDNDHDGHNHRILAEEEHDSDAHAHEAEEHDSDAHDAHEDEELDSDAHDEHSDHEVHREGIDDFGYPFSMTFFPIFDEFDFPRNMVGLVAAAIYWERYFDNALPPRAGPLIVVLENGCNQEFTYSLEGHKFEVLGLGDMHNSRFDHLEEVFEMNSLDDHMQQVDPRDPTDEGEVLTYSGVGLDLDYCPYTIRIYPSVKMESKYFSYQPILYACMVIAVLLFTTAVFIFYDNVVEKRQKKVATTAVKSTAVINSLFPAQVRDRLFHEQETAVLGVSTPKNKLKTFLNEGSDQAAGTTAPIADLFTDCTVLFADISGFTAWSSVREPSQVFTLLETVYGAFDSIARKRKVFKVETIGDCYVAVTGLPEPQADHALILCSFAAECLNVMNHLTKEMEVTLGPDTGDLVMRFGIHSGQVTAGVLRGEKSRFQLFGDTVNTASRMESTGMAGRIQCSETTKELLIKAGKNHWLTAREDAVQAKGKGTLQTFWVTPKSSSSSATESSTTDPTEQQIIPSSCREMDGGASPKHRKKRKKKSPAAALEDTEAHNQRLVGWAADVLQKLLLRVVRERSVVGEEVADAEALDVRQILHESAGSNPINEVVETITLPKFDRDQAKRRLNQSHAMELDSSVTSQLREYVATVASMYRQNPFHNFDHAAHVTQSASKLLNRIKTVDHLVDKPSNVMEDDEVDKNDKDGLEAMASNLHTYTFGITSDPLTQFAVVFSALIHDVDHPGVSNATLIKEGTNIAQLYKEKSVAEQNSIDLAWELLMEERYIDLQRAIFTTRAEYDRFRKLVVNSVIATDIFDKNLKELRNKRWDKAFQADTNGKSGINQDDMDIKATIVLEHLIQASDVAHCMQHWKVYQKWNAKLFEEMYAAFINGRSDTSPEGGWYKGELWFFDNYIIPLAKKLDQCQVFGVSSHEYLDYALQNRKEWETKGELQVEQWMAALREHSTSE